MFFVVLYFELSLKFTLSLLLLRSLVQLFKYHLLTAPAANVLTAVLAAANCPLLTAVLTAANCPLLTAPANSFTVCAGADRYEEEAVVLQLRGGGHLLVLLEHGLLQVYKRREGKMQC